MDLIIFQDDFEDGIRKLFKVLDMKIPGDLIPVLNKTNIDRFCAEEVIQEIKKRNYLDIKLYEYANKFLRS